MCGKKASATAVANHSASTPNAKSAASASRAQYDARMARYKADGFEIVRDNVLLIVTTPKQAANTTGKLFTYCPAKRQPEPAVARMAQHRAAQVQTRFVRLAGVVFVNQIGNAVNGWGYCCHVKVAEGY